MATITYQRARHILDKLGFAPYALATVEEERRHAAFGGREPRSIEERLVHLIEQDFERVSAILHDCLTDKEIEALKQIPSQVRNLL